MILFKDGAIASTKVGAMPKATARTSGSRAKSKPYFQVNLFAQSPAALAGFGYLWRRYVGVRKLSQDAAYEIKRAANENAARDGMAQSARIAPRAASTHLTAILCFQAVGCAPPPHISCVGR